MTLNPRLLVLAVLVASPALASTPALHLVHSEDVTPSTVPLMAPEAAALPYSFHLAPLKLNAELPSHVPLPLPLPSPDQGGGAGVSNDVMPVLAILLALFIGFGTGELVMRDREGFILFLIVDVVIIAVTGILVAVGPVFYFGFGGIGSVALLVSHLIQVLDVYGKAFGGGKILDRTRGSMMLDPPAPATGPDLRLSGGSMRLMSFAF